MFLILITKLRKNIKNNIITYDVRTNIKLVDNWNLKKELNAVYKRKIDNNIENITAVKSFALAPLVVCHINKQNKSVFYNNIHNIISYIKSMHNDKIYVVYDINTKIINIRTNNLTGDVYRNYILYSSIELCKQLLYKVNNIGIISSNSNKNIKIADSYINKFLECIVNKYSLDREEKKYNIFYKWKKIDILSMLDTSVDRQVEYNLIDE